MLRILAILLLAAAITGGAMWSLNLIPSFTDPGNSVNDPVTKTLTPKELGGDLYEPAAFPTIARVEHKRAIDSIVTSGVLTAMEQVELPSQVEGQVLFIGEGVPEGAVQAAGVGSYLAEPYYYTSIWLGKNPVTRFYRRLYEGETVSQDQQVGAVDNAKAIGNVFEKQAKIVAAQAEERAALGASREGENRYNRAKELRLRNAIAEEELGQASLTKIKLDEEYAAKKAGVHVAEQDLLQAEILFRQHEIRNKLPYAHCIIKSILKPRGYAVKGLEPVMQIQSIDRLLAEAQIESQYVERLKGQVRATIEPTQEQAPARPLRGHRRDVTCVAVSKDKDNPLIVSGSEDHTVCVWDRYSPRVLRVLDHKDAIQSIACTPVGADRNLCLSGCVDGTISIWDLNEDSGKPLHVVDTQGEAITSLAFSPDGKYFASGSADGTIRVWIMNEGKDCKEAYPFDVKHGVDNPHHGPVTSLTFLPESVLVSAGRDNTLRVWSLYKNGAKPHGAVIPARDGKVAQLGVSRDGKFMLFDQGRILQLLSVENGSPVTTLQAPGSTTPFETLAIFSPDSSLMLTAGAQEGRLQLWRSPTESERGFEVRQFVTQERWPVTCAAFSPAAGEGGDSSFAVSASKQNVYIWPVPTKDDVNKHRIENVRLTLISQSIDTGTRQVRIGFEVANPDGRLLPGRPVTIVID